MWISRNAYEAALSRMYDRGAASRDGEVAALNASLALLRRQLRYAREAHRETTALLSRGGRTQPAWHHPAPEPLPAGVEAAIEARTDGENDPLYRQLEQFARAQLMRDRSAEDVRDAILRGGLEENEAEDVEELGR